MGEPKTVEGATLIPLISTGFLFGGGGGSGTGEPKWKGEGWGGGSGGIVGVKPAALVIVGKGGVRVEPIKGALATAIEKIAETMPQMCGQMMGKGKEQKEPKKEG
jgi:uncharacterized spore protein YtfJ